MALTDLAGDTLALARSDTESARFGLAVYRMTLPDAFDDFGGLQSAVSGSDADVIVVRYRSDATAIPAMLAALGRPLIPTPALQYWEAMPGRYAASTPSGGPDRLTVSHDLADPATSALAVARIGEIFAGYVNHYAFNPLFDAERSLAGYQEWAERTIRDNPTDSAVLRHDGDVVGVATMLRESSGDGREHTEVALAGLVPAARGRGWYERLLGACIVRTGHLGIHRMVISTQVGNAGVQRAWARMGLLPFDSIETVHLLRPGLLDRR